MLFVRKIISFIKRKVARFQRIVPVYVPVFQSELLKGRSALITGGSGGIGFAVARAFLEAGALVTITGRDALHLKEAKDLLEKFGTVSTIQLDNREVESFATIANRASEFDILVNNAGCIGGRNFGSTETGEYDKVLDTNLRGAYFLSQAVSRKWMDCGVKGNILNVCSASSLRPGTSPYILSKWGLRALTLGMAKSLVRYGITVNGIAPGCTNTPHFCPEESKGIGNPKNPSGRMVTMQEVANLAVVMVSSLARMVVGDVLYITGGGAITTLDD